jgi:hypothetical protein
MRVESDIRLTPRGYEVHLIPAGLDDQESSVFASLGEPVVDCGGAFFDRGMNLAFDLDGGKAAFPSQFPVVREFPMKEDRFANHKAIVFCDAMLRRLVEARDALLERMPLVVCRDAMDF